MIKNRYRNHLLFSTLVITVLVFLAGLFIGYGLDSYKVNDVFEVTKQHELSTESYLTEIQFIESFGGDKCILLESRIDELKAVLDDTRTKLSKYGTDGWKSEDFDYLKRKHTISQIRFLVLVDELNRDCGANYNTILFFYSIDEQVSTNQGFALDKLNSNYPNIIVLSFDLNYDDEALIGLIASKYEIVGTPQLVINDYVFEEGFVAEDTIKEFLELE